MSQHANAPTLNRGAAAKVSMGALLGSKRRTHTVDRTRTQDPFACLRPAATPMAGGRHG
jgi:hypothetical protein